MGQPYVGEIRQFAGNFAPVGWAFCNGSSLPISENETLFTLIGITYGGDGQNSFNLPDLQGRVPVHQGNGLMVGQASGTETETLTTNQLPVHNHVPMSAAAGTSDTPAGNVWAAATNATPYAAPGGNITMNPTSVGVSGGSQPHENRIPFVAVSYIISLFGIFPSQN